MKRTIMLLLILAASFIFSVSGAELLDFTKKKNFYLGEGEYGAISLKVNKYETLTYSSERKNGFTLKKLNDGLIEIIFDISTISGDLAEGKTYSASFNFTKKDIGKTDRLTVSAVYKPELRVVLNDSLRANNARINFTPDAMTDTITVEALKNVNGLKIDDPNSVLIINNGNPVSFKKGLNKLVVKAAKEENFSEEVLIYKSATGGNIDELYVLVSATKFNTVSPKSGISEVSEEDTTASDTVKVVPVAETEASSDPVETGSVQQVGSGMIYIIIISVMGIIILFLLFILLFNKKGDLFTKYETFFNDIATLVKIDPKGGNIDKTIEEIMITLLEKFEFGQEKKEKNETGAKRALKKPANLKSAAVTSDNAEKPEIEDTVELDFSSSGDKKATSKSDALLDPKPTSTGEKKISRGFDFLEEDN
ncbi:MAG TPA: hypothetical protein PLK90_07135 [Clostridiales bacterium]|nr:hypothetical protein [Clostridiales bacterium]HQP70158.1 hypothetical protein [Clostridiales bacterium]